MHAATQETTVMTPPEAIEIAAWVRLARTGDRAAYERLYRAHVGRVHALCLRLSGERTRASELTQDAFVQAWQKLSGLESDAAFASWLYRLTVNMVLMRLRRDKKWSAREAGSDVLEAVEPVRGRRDDGAGARVDLERAIAALPSQARVVFVLHDVEGYRHEEIANHMNIAVGTSKAQLHRARRLLREVLDR
ncbi:MAG TPA: RNA polymerase sigma factor [Candidatus Krumholzibacteria bacterium]|nr:RNA polymerase sigma factor [Candidatus Krumholzibacteria bacterium]